LRKRTELLQRFRNFQLELILLAIILLTFMAVFSISPVSPIAPVRWFLGATFVLFLPGYVLSRIVFPRKSGKIKLEQVVYSIALSLAAISFVGMILGRIPYGIDLGPIFLSLTIFIIFCITISYYRGKKNENQLKEYHLEKRLHYTNITIYVFVFVLLLAPIILKMSFITIDLHGNKFGMDIATYTYWSNVVDQTKGIPNWSEYMSLEQPSKFSPGIPILFSIVSQITGVEPIKFTFVYYVLAFEAIAFSICVMFIGYLHRKWPAFLGLFFWIFGKWFSDAIVFSSPEKVWPLNGVSPPNVIGWLFLVVFLLSVFNFEKTQDFRNIIVMFILIESTIIYHQLSFIILGTCFIVFLVFYRSQIKVRFLVFGTLITLGLTMFLAPSWLTDYTTANIGSGFGIERSTILKWAPITSVKFEDVPRLLGYLATFFTLLGFLSMAKFSEIRKKKLIVSADKKNLYLGACLLVLILIAHYAPYVSGLQGMRFFYYAPFFVLPLMVNGICKSFDIVSKRRRIRTLALLLIFLIALVSISEGTIQTCDLYEEHSQEKFVFDSLEQDAVAYLKDHMDSKDVIVADLQRTKDTVWIRTFSMKKALVLPSVIHIEMSPPPFDAPLKTIQTIFATPNVSNVMNGLQQYNFTYYFYEKNYHQKEIEVFNLLPYFAKAFENSKVIIYKVDPSKFEDGDIIQAESFVNASKGVSMLNNSHALGGLHIGSLLASSRNFDGNYSIYNLHISKEDTYEFVVRRYVNQPQEYITVHIDDKFAGYIVFTDIGWQFGNLTNVKMCEGTHSIKFMFMGTSGWSDGMDYFILHKDLGNGIPIQFNTTIQAESYVNATKGIKAIEKASAKALYLTSSEPNSGEFDGNYTTYAIRILKNATYTLAVRRYVYQPEEYIAVYVDSKFLGNVSFSGTDWQFGFLTNIEMLVGNHSMKIMFMKTVGWSDGMDYFILTRAPTL